MLALLTRERAYVFPRIRVKTAAVDGASHLNNKAQQIGSDDWGVFYPHNSLDATELEPEGALPPGAFEAVTRPAIYAAVRP